MSPTQARAFHAVALAGSFTAAARVLRISQPTVTTQVRALERHYGVELFYRHARGVQLTAAGKQLLAILQRMYASQSEAVEFLRSVEGLRSGYLRVGSYGPHYVTEMLARFHYRYPGIQVSVVFENSEHLSTRLLNYELDIAVMGRECNHAQLYALAYARPRVVIIAPKSDPLASRRVIDIEDLEGRRMVCREPGSEIRRIFEGEVRRAGVRFETAMELGSREGVIAAVAEGVGLGIMSEEGTIPTQRVVKLRVRNADMYTNVAVLCLTERRNALIIRTFLGVVEELVEAQETRRRTVHPRPTTHAPGAVIHGKFQGSHTG